MPREETQFNSVTGAKAAASRKNPGRKKNIYNILKETGYSKSDIITAYSEISFYNELELSEVADDPEKPVIVRIIARIMRKALEDGAFRDIKDIAEQLTGKPQQKVDHSGEIAQPVLQCTPEQKAFMQGDKPDDK